MSILIFEARLFKASSHAWSSSAEIIYGHHNYMISLAFEIILCRPHPNECSGGDLDGDLFSISWDERLIPAMTVAPMDYISRRPRVMDHKVSLEVCSKNPTLSCK